MAKLYSDYISLDNNFIPVFSEDADKANPDHWRGYIPHQTFIDILGDLIDTINKKDPRYIWIRGTYGSGKSFSAYTIKHLFEESDENVEMYLNKHASISSALKNKLINLRYSGKILVVNRSSSSGINSDKRLFSAIQESVKKALDEKGLSCPMLTAYDDTVKKLSEENSTYRHAFINGFKKHQDLFPSYASYGEVINYLSENKAENASEVFANVVEVLEEEDINIPMDAAKTKEWLKEVISANKLRAVLFIWDEFTEYFLNNPNNISAFQEFTQFYADDFFHFHLIIITHRDSRQLGLSKDSSTKLEGRFKNHNIQMKESTAIELMAKSINVIDSEWNNNLDSLFNRTEKTIENIKKYSGDNIDEDNYKRLIPMHPMTSFLLQRISSDIGSDKRTMFNFLSDQNDNSGTNFYSFINTVYYDNSKPAYLTADCLWDYFFGENVNSRKVDIDEKITNLVEYYESCRNYFSGEEESRVFKTIMLLCAVHKGGFATGANWLLRPALSNIRRCFYGTEYENKIVDIIGDFEKNNIISISVDKNNEEVIFSINSTPIDKEEISSIAEKEKKVKPFDEILKFYQSSFIDKLSFTNYMKLRFSCRLISIKTINDILEINNNNNVLPVFFLFAKNESEQSEAVSKIKNISEMQQHINFVIIDLTSIPFGDENYDEYINKQALAKYFKEYKPDQTRANSEETKAENIIKEFFNKFNSSTITIYANYPEENVIKPEKVKGIKSISDKLIAVNKKIYPYCLESITENDNIFKEQKTIKKNLGEFFDGSSTIAPYLKDLREKLYVLNDRDYYINNTEHPVSKMKIEIKGYIDKQFKKQMPVSISEIWNILKKKPFGLMNCPGSEFIFAFLMKEYSQGYYYSEENEGENKSLNSSKLAEIIDSTVKDVKNYFLFKMNPKQKDFCELSRKIFEISEDAESIESVIKKIKDKVNSYEFPLWVYKYSLENQNDEKSILYERIISKYEKIISLTGNNEINSLSEDIAASIRDNNIHYKDIRETLKSNNLGKGFSIYIDKYKPEIKNIRSKLNIESYDLISDIGKNVHPLRFAECEKDKINKAVDEIYIDYSILELLSPHLKEIYPIDRAINALSNKFNSIKLPKDILIKDNQDIKPAINILYSFSCGNNVHKESLLSELNEHSERLFEIFNNEENIAFSYISNQLKIDDNEYIKSIYRDCEINYSDSINDFNNEINRIHNSKEINKKINKLKSLWKEKTNSDNPRSWSSKNKIAIKYIINDNPDDINALFEILNSPENYKDKIEWAISFIQDNNELPILIDIEQCRKIFKKRICEEYEPIIDNFGEIIDIINEKAKCNYYDIDKYRSSIDEAIARYANEKYIREDYKKALEKINHLGEKELKKYLSELIQKDTLLGIRIIESGKN